MKYKKYWMRFSLLLIVIIAVSYITYSCSDYDSYDSYTSYFTPHTVSVKNCEPYYYSLGPRFYESISDSSNMVFASLQEKNTNEWKAYTKLNLTQSDIEKVLYELPISEIQQWVDDLNLNRVVSLSDSMRDNGFVKWLCKHDNMEALNYLLFAKKCEPIAMANRDEWNVVEPDLATSVTLMNYGIKKLKVCTDAFFKERYVFQIIRMSFYGKQYQQTLALYDSLMPSLHDSRSSISSRTQSLKAGTLFRLHKYAESAYLFSRLFEMAEDHQHQFNEYLGFDWAINDKRLQAVLQCCKNNHEKAIVYAMQGFRHPEIYQMRTLRKVYELDPENQLLDVLLVREVCKAEEAFDQHRDYLTRGYNYYLKNYSWMGLEISAVDFNHLVEKKYQTKLKLMKPATFMLHVANEAKVKDKALWVCASAYMYLLNEDFKTADSLLLLAKQMKPSLKVEKQVKILQLMNSIIQCNEITPQFESEILPQLVWLDKLSDNERIYQLAYSNIMRNLLPMKYLNANEKTKAMLCYVKYENLPKEYYYYDETQTLRFDSYYYNASGQLIDTSFSVHEIKNCIQYMHSSHSAFDKWLLYNNVYKEDILYEVMGIKYLQHQNFEEAIKAFKQAKSSIKVNNPFVAHIRDYQDGYYQDSLQRYSLLALSDTMHKLEIASKDNLESAFHLACALYSISYYGKAWQAVAYYRSSYHEQAYHFDSLYKYSDFDKQYLFNERAYGLFKRVYDQSNIPLIKQKCVWMMAKIYQKRFPGELNDMWGYAADGKADAFSHWNSHENPFLIEFNKKYKSTPFYDSVYRECSYLRNFVKQ